MESRPGETATPAFAAVLEDGERHDFDTKDAFDRFIAGTRYGDQVGRTRDAAGGATRPTPADVQAVKAKTGKIDRELTALAKRLGLAPNSRELFERATVKREPGEQAIFDATWLFPQPMFVGAPLSVYGDVYNLADLGWNAGVGSIMSDRSITLYSRPGFDGSQLWVFVPAGRFATVGNLGTFANTASLQYQR